MTVTLPHPRTNTDDTTPCVSRESRAVRVLAVAVPALVALTIAAITWGAWQHPTALFTALAVNMVGAFTVATWTEIRDAYRAPKGIGSWRVKVGLPPLDLP